MYNYQNKKNQAGLSLIEIMVAISILSVAFISLMYAFPLGLSISKDAENSTLVSYLAQEKIEEVHSLGYEDMGIGAIEAKHRLSDDPANYLYDFERTTTVEYIDGNLSASVNNTGMKKISTTIYYTDAIAKKEKTYNITSIISEK